MIDWSHIFSSDMARGALISAAAAGIGVISHQVAVSAVQGRQLALHEQQIQELFKATGGIHTDIQDLTLTAVRIEGKVNVINQKLDDDRRLSDSGH